MILADQLKIDYSKSFDHLFMNGHNWAVRGLSSLDEELLTYSEYWKQKILRNIQRDEENNRALRALGWTVIRFWESDITIIIIRGVLVPSMWMVSNLCE